MKKTYNFLMSVAVAAMAFIGCTNTEISIDNNPAPAPVDGVYRQLTFAADTESDASRTHHTGETIHWSKGDRIRIGYTREGVWQNAEGRAQDDDSTAKLYASTEQDSDAELSVFRVTQLFKDTEAKGEIWFYGLYPSEITKRNEPDFSNSKTGEINVYIPWIQAPTATSFDPKADLLVSKSRHSYESFPSYDEHIKMVWTRLVAHGQITLKNLLGAGMVEGEKISFVEFTVDEGVNLTGDFTLTLNIADPDQPHMPTITSKSGSKNKVRLSFAENTEYNTLDGEGNFVVWFATAPFTTESLNVKVGTDKAIYTRNIANANKTFKVNTRSTLGINMASATRSDLELGESWELMTDASVLAEGKKIVIAAADYDVAMSTTQNNNNRAETAITKSETKNTITIDSDVQVLTVGKGTTDGTWSLYDEDKTGYLYAASTSSNHLKTKAALDATGSWTIEVTNTGLATIKSAGRSDTQPGTMRYNATNSPPIFSCYKASNQMKDISIYHNATALEQLAKPVISRLTEVEAKAVLVEWEEVENALYYSIKCQKDGTTTDKGIVIFKNITDTSFVADNLSDGTWNITVTAYGDGYYSNTSDSASITVTGVTPTVEANPTELTFTSAGGEKSIEVSTTNLGNSVEIDAVSNNDAFSVLVNDATVTVVAEANPTTEPRSGIITITARGAMTIACDVAVSQEAKPEGERTYTKIDKYLADFSGQYLIVYEGDDTHASVAFDGSLAELDAPGNNKSVTITDGTITLSAAEDLFYFTIEKVEGGYTIKSSNANGDYIGQTANDNGMATGTNAYINTISYSNEGIVIKASSKTATYLRYNYTNSETGKRFRYYMSGQQPIQLYRLEGTGYDTILTQLATPTNVEAEVNNVNTISVTWTTVPNADSYTVTCGTASKTVTDTSAEFTDLEYETKYDITVVANPAANSTEYYASEPGTASATTEADPNAGGSGEGSNATDVIDRPFTGVSDTSYTEWTGTGTSGAVYAGQSAGGNDAVQLRSNNNNSGIIVTKSAGKVSKVIVTWNSNTADGRTLNIYGKNTAYSAATDLYNESTAGTKLGTIVCGTSTELTINGDYEYIGLRSNSGAMYITQIQIVWVTSGNAGGGEGGGEGSGDSGSDITLTFTSFTNNANNYTTTWEQTCNGNTWSIANFNNNYGNNGWTYIKCGSKNGASVASIATTFSIATAVKSVKVTVDAVTATAVNSTYLQVATDAAFSNIVETVNVTIAQGEVAYNITNPQANCYYKLVYDCAQATKNGTVQISKVVYSAE